MDRHRFPSQQEASQHRVHPTGGSRRVFEQFVWLGVSSAKAALPRPAHPRVTHSVRQRSSNEMQSHEKDKSKLG